MILHNCCMYSVKYSFMLFSPFSKCFEKFLRINNGQLSLSHFAKSKAAISWKSQILLGKSAKVKQILFARSPNIEVHLQHAGGKPRWWRPNKYWIKYLFALHQFLFVDRKQTFDIFLGDMMHVLCFKFYINQPGKCTLPESFWCIPF